MRFLNSIIHRPAKKLHWIPQDMGIDLGTSSTLVYVKKHGIVLREPSVVAIDPRTQEILAVGEKAQSMVGRTPGNVVTIRPLQQGVIADFNTTRTMLQYFIHKVVGNLRFLRPRVVVSIPHGTTQVEKRAVWEAARQAGAKEAYLMEEPVAAAIGAGLPVDEPQGSMVVDIGGGTTEVAIIALGGVVYGTSLALGGNSFDDAIIRYLRREYNLDIGERTAEEVKLTIGYATAPPEETMDIRGLHLASGLPRILKVSAREIHEAVREPLDSIIETIHRTLERTPPELAADVMDFGITLTGGGSQMRKLDELIHQRIRIPVHLAEDPVGCVARGTGKALEELNILQRTTIHEARGSF